MGTYSRYRSDFGHQGFVCYRTKLLERIPAVIVMADIDCKIVDSNLADGNLKADLLSGPRETASNEEKP